MMDGKAGLHKTPTELLEFLNKHQLTAGTAEHRALFTVEDSQSVRDELPPGTPGGFGGGHCKNLFLKNKKNKMWLVVMLEDKQLNIKAIAEVLGAGRLSFASSDRLMTYLGVIPGAVTPFSIINDKESHVQVILDQQMLTHEILHYHPLTNTMTTMITPDNLLKFLALCNHEPHIMDLPV